MRCFFAVLFILLGAFLLSLTINEMGNAGHIIMRTIGFGCFGLAALTIKKGKHKIL